MGLATTVSDFFIKVHLTLAYYYCLRMTQFFVFLIVCGTVYFGIVAPFNLEPISVPQKERLNLEWQLPLVSEVYVSNDGKCEGQDSPFLIIPWQSRMQCVHVSSGYSYPYSC